MKLLKLFTRMAFICNLCFMGALFILWLKHPPEGEIISLIIVMGYLMAVVINGIVSAGYLIRVIARKPLLAFIPGWLIIVNAGFLIIQLILFLK